MENAYVPYSNYPVGATILTMDDKMYTGCNIENASFGLTNCAERTAIFKAISEGHTKVKAVAVICKGNQKASPCGACRQVLTEFAEADSIVILSNEQGEYDLTTVKDLLPSAFTTSSMRDDNHDL